MSIISTTLLLEASADGKTWTAPTGELQKTYVIHMEGRTGRGAQCVRIRKLQSEKKSWCAVREFEVKPDNSRNTAIQRDSPGRKKPQCSLSTAIALRSTGKLTFGIENGTKSYTLLLNMKPQTEIKFNQYNKKASLSHQHPSTTETWFSINVEGKKL